MQNIEARAAVERMAYAQQDFARVVNESIEIDRRAKEAGLENWQAPGYKEQFEKLSPDVERLRKEMHDSFIDGTKPILQAIHLEYMRNIWFALSGAAFVLGVFLTLIGFRIWLKQPKKER